MLGVVVNAISRGVVSGQRVFELLDTESTVQELAEAIVGPVHDVFP